MTDNRKYDKELVDMRDVKLPQYREAITDAYNKATKQFKDDFISRLRSAIEGVEIQIDDLNQALSQSVFGNDTYRFTCRPSQLYHRYYDMIKDDLLLQVGEDESAFIEKYSDKVTVFDCKDFELQGISDEFRWLLSPVMMNAILQRISKNMEVITNHSLDYRRYYRKVDY